MDSLPQQLLLQVILIGINAFFASAEIAVLSLNVNRLHRMAEEGDKKAPKMLKLLEEPSGFLSTIQVGITLAGFLASAFAADNFSDYLVTWVYEGLGFQAIPRNILDGVSVIVITVILSYFTLVFGELVPKRIAMQKPMELARFSYTIIAGVAKIMRPVVNFLSFSTNAILRLLRMKTNADAETASEEDIRMMVEMSGEKGVIDQEEEEWIQNVFDFHESTVEDVMTRPQDIIPLKKSASSEEVTEIIRDTGFSRFPVIGKNRDEVLGILYTKDFFLKKERDWNHLIRPAYFVPESMQASVLFQNLRKQKQHMAVVVDEYGQVAGLATMEDLLEEIVGNIYDEFDRIQREDIEKINDTLWRLSGTATIEDINEVLQAHLPEHEDYDTLAGLIYTIRQSVPEDHETFTVTAGDLQLEVTEIQERKIKTVMASKIL